MRGAWEAWERTVGAVLSVKDCLESWPRHCGSKALQAVLPRTNKGWGFFCFRATCSAAWGFRCAPSPWSTKISLRYPWLTRHPEVAVWKTLSCVLNYSPGSKEGMCMGCRMVRSWTLEGCHMGKLEQRVWYRGEGLGCGAEEKALGLKCQLVSETYQSSMTILVFPSFTFRNCLWDSALLGNP